MEQNGEASLITKNDSSDETSGEVNPSSLAQTNENDGKIILSFYDNDMEVRGDFFPPMGDGTPISPDYIRALFEKFNIRYGIKKNDLHQAYQECVKEQRIVKDVIIARGDHPVNERLEYVQLNPFLTSTNTQDEGNAQVDHRVRSPFIIVKKDQALAKQKSRKPGKEGRNVRGETIAFAVVRPEGVSGGQNTRMEGRLLLSDINGQMVVSKKIVHVRDSLVINGPVGYATGNIIFPGDVEIEGPVSDGFKINSGGSVTIKQTFDVTNALTKNDLNVAGGIIGRGEAIVKVGGALKTKFIENCRVACRKIVSVDTEIINSNIFTLETLEMGDKGCILGGEIYALKGVRANSIGKKSGKASRIHCGIDFTLEQEREKNNSYLRILVVKINRLKQLMEENQPNAKKVKMEAFLKKLEDEQQKTQARITELLGKLKAYEEAVLEVSGEIAIGTLIEICKTALFVTSPLKRVRIRLEKESGKLITEKYS